MNKSILILCSCVLAGNLQAQTPDDTSNIMQQMQAMEECMAKIDQRELELMEQRSMELQQQINALCSQGNADEARKVALQFSDEVMQSKSMQTMQKCASLVPGMQQQLEVQDFEQELGQQSICDYINQ